MKGQDNLAVKTAPSPTPQNATANQQERTIPEWKKHFFKANDLRTVGKFEEAIEEYKKSIEAGHDDKEVYREIALILISMKRYEEAVDNLRKVLEKDSEDAPAHWALSRVLVENLGRYHEGLEEAKLAQKLYGDDGLSYVRDRVIGQAYDGLGDYENAIKHYQIFLKGSSFAPDANDYKVIKKRVSELEQVVKSSNYESKNK